MEPNGVLYYHRLKFSLNCWVILSTKFAAAELAFGQKLANPIDIVIGVGVQSESHAQFVIRIQQLIGAAQGAMECVCKDQKAYYKKHYSVVEFQNSDKLVYKEFKTHWLF